MSETSWILQCAKLWFKKCNDKKYESKNNKFQQIL